ncbi:hypothetical protein SAMN02799636_05582 [Methylobacterium sp. 275MFSha3.1]|nr:hypothetical protein SAMN02799636_05582 [Methylobacterium sp. 275MFSha3.1]
MHIDGNLRAARVAFDGLDREAQRRASTWAACEATACTAGRS